jgi:N-acetylglucosamine malate deacetylase 1
MKILVISPHMDDETLGVGGTIAKHVASGDEVHVIVVAHRVYNHQYDQQATEIEKKATLNAQKVLEYQHLEFLDLPDERLDHCIQEILIPLEDAFNQIKPEVLYSPFYGDNNQDHRAVFEAARVLARPASHIKVKRFLLYEVLSSTDQSPPLPHNVFLPNFYVNISETIDKKLEALCCYERELRPFPHPRSETGIRTLALKRGMEAGFSHAESFMLLRDEWS